VFKSRHALVIAVSSVLASSALAQQVSQPVVLQWFESSWRNIERRTPDHFTAGYGSIWVPPPGRAVYIPQGGGIGYDPYDRFDLGSPRDSTLYGTEGTFKSAIKSVQKTGGSVYVDYVHHHVGSLDLQLNGYTYPPSLLNQNVPYLPDRSAYPGFELSDPNNPVSSPFHRDTYAALYGANASQIPFGDVFEYWFRLGENLVTVDLASNRSFVRHPVPGNPQNIRESTANWAVPTTTILPNGRVGADSRLRQANVPSADNRRFYPDLNGPSRTVIDSGVSYTVHDFNNANPQAGDPVAETPRAYMMRYAQWLLQSVGVDGLRIDAARHVPLGVFNSGYNPQSLDIPKLIDRAVAGASFRTNLDGTRRDVFQFQEIFNYDPNFLETFVRKSQPAGDTVNPNRDVLDFSMWRAMAQNMTGNGLANDWFNIRSASLNASVFNTLDANIANNGANGIGFVYNHDEGISPPGTGGTITLDNVAHAWILMRPGNAYVYYRSNEFDRTGNNNFFLKQGRGDALGGVFGNILTTLVDVRNSHGRGDFIQRWIDNEGPGGIRLASSAIYVFERQGSAVVGLNIGYNPGATTRLVQTSFTSGTRLEELTGNWQDPSGQVPRVIAVDSNGRANVSIPWNNAANGNKGYVVYGLPLPRGSLVLSNVASIIADPDPTAVTNGTARITDVSVISSDFFDITLNTNAVTLADGFRDRNADGDRALLRINDGFDANGNGSADFPSSAASNATRYGFEAFQTINSPGFSNANGTGQYRQTVNAAALGEGFHYLTARAWRRQGAQESEVFKDFRTVLYVDRLPADMAVDSFSQSGVSSTDRELRVRSVDKTADSVHVLFNLGAGLTESQIASLANAGNKSDWIDADLFGIYASNVPSGNHVVTTVTFEPSGRRTIERHVGLGVTTSRGQGVGDVNFDGGFSPADVLAFEGVLYTQDAQFNPAADLNADGWVDWLDLSALPARYASLLETSAFDEAGRAIVRRGDLNSNGSTDGSDIDLLHANLGTLSWLFDIDSTRDAVDRADVDTLVRSILVTEYGDGNLDGAVDFGDLLSLAQNYGATGGWAAGDFSGDGVIEFADLLILAQNYGEASISASTFADDLILSGMEPFYRMAIPEPATLLLAWWVALLGRRR
jgi:hypothetical protein